MFGLSWAQIGIIVLVGAFVLGPERIPTAVTFVTGSLRKVRSMAAGAQAGLRSEIGPELDELRRQVAELQSLKEIQELRDLRDLHPKNLIGTHLLGPELSGGVSGFLGFGPSSATGGGAIDAFAAQAAAVRPSADPSVADAVPAGAAADPGASAGVASDAVMPGADAAPDISLVEFNAPPHDSLGPGVAGPHGRTPLDPEVT